VQEVVADGVAKTVNHDNGNEQRHAEVEVLAQESRGSATGLVVIREPPEGPFVVSFVVSAIVTVRLGCKEWHSTGKVNSSTLY
jgi:hypothetical protein